MIFTKETLEAIGESIAEGLTEEEACVLVDATSFQLEAFIRANPVLNNYLAKKRIEFKKKNLSIINGKRDPKNSIWMLERLMPEQFGAKKDNNISPENVLAVFINQIQERGSNNLVKVYDQSNTQTQNVKKLTPQTALS